MLTPRQRMILAAIVEDYIRFAEPVGSRTLSKHQEFQLSPATIRNEMADLEELGYLDQPHTSAGRIPSQKGYRYYVDHLAAQGDIDPATVHMLRVLFQQRLDEVERVIQQTSVVLSQLTQYATIALGPAMHQQKIKHIQLVPLGGQSAVAILVTDTGHVENRHVQLADDIPPDDVVRLVNLLNAKLVGTPVGRMRSHLYREIASEMANVLERYEDLIAVLDQLSEVADDTGRVYVGGAANMLVQPEFRDVEKARPVLELLEQADGQQVRSVLPMGGSGVQVRIGMENTVPTLQDCTVIAATYQVGGVPAGSIGVIGPTRMNYVRVIRILEYTASALTRVMTERLAGG
ncbi:MAG: heat-inducible transcriptional repressor HrcA [Alicyclobacillus sp.]|nr:heat-inducible transcriptional repressor HrcA [Alicyclobacillus sp.]